MIRALVITILAIVGICVLLPAKAQSHPAWGIAVDRHGQIYFSDLKTIWKIDAYGKPLVFRAADDRHTHEMNIDEAGNVYGEDNFSAIWRMTPAGSFFDTLTYRPIGTSVRKVSPDGKVLVLATIGENTNPPTRATPVGTSLKSVVPPTGFASHVLNGLCASVLASLYGFPSSRFVAVSKTEELTAVISGQFFRSGDCGAIGHHLHDR